MVKKLRKRYVGLILVVVLLLSAFTYYLAVNRNSRDMSVKQKILRAVYPVFTSVTRMFGKNSEVLTNSNYVRPSQSLYDLHIKLNSGSDLQLSNLAGKKILFVNTASDCGYTGQYDELQKLQSRFAGKLQVIGFPANDFSEQEKGSDEQIMQFCKLNYGITFPLSVKSVVVQTPEQHPVFRWLSDKSQNGWNSKAPSWNFSKYLVDEHGVLTHYFDPSVNPLGTEVIDAIIKPAALNPA